jgi:acetyltransferase-like isoleucine patch superfamily enzyme
MINCYSLQYLKQIGVNLLGTNINISKYARIYNPTNLTIHDNVRIDDFTILSCKGKIEIYNNVHISAQCFISSSTSIIIHSYSSISVGVKLFGSNDDYSGNFMANPTVPKQFLNVTNGDIIIEKHSIIGSNSVVLPNITIAEGTAIGCQSFVNKTTESWKIYAGSPIKYIKNRHKNCLVLEEEYKLLL